MKLLVWALFGIWTSVVSAERITFMTYNVENLFDTEHDSGKIDYTYLPLSVKRGKMKREVESYCNTVNSKVWRKQCFNWDWSAAVVREKMQRLSRVIRDVQGSMGEGPDVLLLQEVENLNVLQILEREFLSDLGYTVVLIDGWDNRGIDVAVLSKLPLLSKEAPVLHEVPGGKYKIRGILQVNLMLPDSTPLSVFALHFPSQANPRQMREAALRRLNELRDNLPSGRLAIAGGDSNVTKEEERIYGLLKKYSHSTWEQVSDSCLGCKGTSYYSRDGSWSFLDRFFISKSSPKLQKNAWQLDPQSVRVHDDSEGQVDSQGRPLRFDLSKHGGSEGISDHLPLVFELKN